MLTSSTSSLCLRLAVAIRSNLRLSSPCQRSFLAVGSEMISVPVSESLRRFCRCHFPYCVFFCIESLFNNIEHIKTTWNRQQHLVGWYVWAAAAAFQVVFYCIPFSPKTTRSSQQGAEDFAFVVLFHIHLCLLGIQKINQEIIQGVRFLPSVVRQHPPSDQIPIHICRLSGCYEVDGGVFWYVQGVFPHI